jgi:hypothetical protein
MRELGQMLRVDVHVQTNPGLPGSVLLTLLTTWCPGIPAFASFISSTLNDALYRHPVLITDTLCSQDKTRTTLTMEDLGAALSEYSINSRKPEFYL